MKSSMWIPESLRMASVCLVGLLLLLVGACGKSGNKEAQSRQLAIVDGFEINCPRTRSPDLRTKIVFGPNISCTSSNPECPAGSFCSPAPASVCTLECDPDNRCPDGKYCSCDGVCSSNGDNSQDGGAPLNTACPLDAALLQSSATLTRTCHWDDECPYGSRCDRATGACKWDCLNDVKACGAGSVCNCLGQCQPASGADADISKPSTYSPRLTVQPVGGTLIPAYSDPATPWGTDASGVGHVRKLIIELSAAQLTKAANGTEYGPSPEITIKPDKNLQVKCGEGSTAFRAAGEACVFASWTYTGDVTPSGAKVIHASNTVTVRPISNTAETAPTLWDVRVSGVDVDGAPMTITYRYPGETSRNSSTSASDAERTVDHARYGRSSPYVGTAIVTTPLGHTLSVPVKAHIISNMLVLYDPSRLLAPNGVLPLSIVDAETPPVPLEAYVRWVYLDQSPDYFLELDARATLLSFRQTSDTDGPITARAKVLLNNSEVPDRGEWGPAYVAINLHASNFRGCEEIGDEGDSLECGKGEVCEFGFCVEQPPPPFHYGAEGELTERPLGRIRNRTFDDWDLYMPSAADMGAWPSDVWCVQPDGFKGGWRSIASETFPAFVDGDIACPMRYGVTKPWAGPFPFSHRQTLEQAGSLASKLNNSQLFSACLKELNRSPPSRTNYKGPASSFDDYKNGLLDIVPDCINLGAMVLACDSSGWSLKTSEGWERKRFSMRTAQEWVRLHGFLMHQGVEQYKQEDVILRQTTSSGGQADTTPSSPDPASLMAIMEKGLTAFLNGNRGILGWLLQYDSQGHPLWMSDYRTGVGMTQCMEHSGTGTGNSCPSNMRCETAAETDASPYDDCPPNYRNAQGGCAPGSRYRHCVMNDASLLPNSDDVPNGFVPVLTDALTGYLRVVEADLDRALVDGYAVGSGAALGARAAPARKALARYGTAMRLTISIESLSSAIAKEEKTCTVGTDGTTTCSDPRWYERWLKAATELHLQMNRAQTAASKLAAGANPLGVPDNDTPIFFGDVTGPNSRYFASSDYLINTWADPAVKSAQSSLDSARGAWIAARNATITTEENKAAHDRRMDDIASSAGRDVLDNCGGVVIGGTAVAARDVVPSITSLGTEQAEEYLNTCFVQGGGRCTLAPPQDVVNETRRWMFSVAAARSELCRLDYMRVKYKSLWDAHIDKVVGLRGALEAFMAPGIGYFCRDCAQNPTPPTGCDDLANCTRDCFFDYRSDPTGGDSGWKSDSECQYRAEDCETIAKKTFPADIDFGLFTRNSQAYYWSSEWPCWSSLFTDPETPGTPEHATRDRTLSKCVDHPGFTGGCVGTLLGLCTAYNSAARPTEVNKRAGEYLKDCMARHVHTEVRGQNPRQTPANRSSTWQGVTLATDPDGRVRIHLSGDSMNVDNFYWDALAKLRTEEKGAPWSEATAVCAADGFQTPLPDFTVPKECLHGKLGHAYQAMVDIWAQADALSAQLVSAVRDWTETLLACNTKGNLTNQALLELKTYLEQRSSLLDAAGDVAVMKATVDGAIGGIGKGGAAGAIYFGAMSHQFADMAESLRRGITKLDGAHTIFIAEMTAEVNGIDCALQTKKAYNAIRPIQEQIATKFDECQTAQIAFESMKIENWDRYDTARAQLDSEEHRTVGDLAHHYWYDEKVEKFGKDMAWAKQTTYLAVRAVEFEFQETLDLRRQVVAARHPDQLAAAVLAMKQVQATRSVNRRRPEESSIVLSLRDDVLGIEDHTKSPSGERNWTSAQRFMGRLWDEGYRIRDQSGKWLGQGVQFSLREGGVLLNRCGERLWRVTATVQGDGLSPLAPGTPLYLLKRNTFYSQFCRGHGDGQVHQVNSVRPSSQLFTGGSTGVPDGAEDFSTAAIFPWFNVRRFDFYNVDYQKGASEELAGRGVYGDYILLFPKEILDEQASPRFPLGKVEDVLLRLDYLSVDNLAGVSGSGPAVTTGDSE
jgi:hypothetical protein